MGQEFKIETVKWAWAKEVKRQEIHRDDEFVRTKTKEEALAAIDWLMAQRKGTYCYCITVARDGEYFTYFRHSMPCYGGLVKYKDSHGPRYYMNSYFPRDIYVAFPEGDITFIAVEGQPPKTAWGEFVFSQESPWVSAFGSKDTIVFKSKYFVLTNMDTDPTVLYSLLRLSSYTGSVYMQSKWDPRAQLLIGRYMQGDPRRFAGQKPIRTSAGTWAEGYGYTRPYNESIWKTSLPKTMKEFDGLAGYAMAPFTSEYFKNTMKDKFGMDITKPFEKPLLEAWDYFKKESAALGDVPGVDYTKELAKV